MTKRAEIVDEFPAGDDHRVVEVIGTSGSYRRKPCEECPWRVDKTGNFPAEAFRHSANTAEDGATHTFACHMNGIEKPVDCAGFLLQNADHNLAVRMRIADGKIDPDEVGNPDGLELHEDYRAMSIANGVPPDDPAIAKCRGNGYGDEED